MSEVLYRSEGAVATITLNRPERRNALTEGMFTELAAGLRRAEADPGVRCIVITGAGEAFSAGLDLVAAMGALDRLEKLAFEFHPHHEPIVVMQEIDTPVVAALNGPAAGYAVGIALNADIRVMARNARLVPATKRNLVPESGDTYLLPRLVGWERAARFYFLGDDLGGEEALAAGMVSELADDSDATKARARELAEQVAAMPPLGVQAAKRMMRAGRSDEYPAHVQRVLLQLLPLFRTKDFAEAVAAFLEKRPADFSGE
ncbi:MAG TPA: enoyl-CoA hydratase/isomerase family protein [Gemmatimonadales bacterium]|nr:enoyl-CoA hydratase/isomerase family protein [Gemmatimonadales bacterium]